ncbi:MAG: hypothetical protein ACXQTS_06700 [Candidatus Methanospirareceae archaeon]
MKCSICKLELEDFYLYNGKYGGKICPCCDTIEYANRGERHWHPQCAIFRKKGLVKTEELCPYYMKNGKCKKKQTWCDYPHCEQFPWKELKES